MSHEMQLAGFEPTGKTEHLTTTLPNHVVLLYTLDSPCDGVSRENRGLLWSVSIDLLLSYQMLLSGNKTLLN